MSRTHFARMGVFMALGFHIAVSSVFTEEARLKVPVSVLADHLVYKGAAIRETNFTIWGSGPVLDNEGKVHLFAARWPEANVDPAWRKSSEIAHYESGSPEGPFRFVGVVAKSTGRTGEWDAFAPHNPEVKRFGDTYALVYIANSDFRQPPHPPLEPEHRDDDREVAIRPVDKGRDGRSGPRRRERSLLRGTTGGQPGPHTGR